MNQNSQEITLRNLRKKSESGRDNRERESINKSEPDLITLTWQRR